MPSEASWSSLAILHLGTLRLRQGSLSRDPERARDRAVRVLFKEITHWITYLLNIY